MDWTMFHLVLYPGPPNGGIEKLLEDVCLPCFKTLDGQLGKAIERGHALLLLHCVQ